MAVARLEPARVRRYNPGSLRGKPVERRVRTPHRALAVAVILAGGFVQHVLATAPAEPQPVPLAVAALAGAPAGASVVQARSPRAAAPPRARVLVHRLDVHRMPAAARHSPSRIAQPAVHAVMQVRAVVSLHRPPTGQLRSRHLSPLLPPPGARGDTRRIAMGSNPQGLILHVPSISVSAIRAALRAAGSPVLDASFADGKDAAEYIWDSGRVLGVDPAVVVAIFRHESVFGTQGMARLTNSVGNIRPLPGQPTLNGYRLYGSWEEGIDDCYRLLRSYARHGATTVAQAIPVWAPPSDNNDDSAYIASVLDTMGALNAASTEP